MTEADFLQNYGHLVKDPTMFPNRKDADVWGNVHYFHNKSRLRIEYKDGTVAHFDKNGKVWKTENGLCGHMTIVNLIAIIKNAIAEHEINSYSIDIECFIATAIMDRGLVIAYTPEEVKANLEAYPG